MRVNICSNNPESQSGKHKFLSRLCNALQNKGIDILSDNPDVFLFMPGSCKHIKSKVNILRLDGLTIDNKVDFNSKNAKILKCIDMADAIVYQNTFCKQAYEKFLGINKPNTCILNGANKKEFLPRKVENIFLANANWRPHKRLDAICKSFLLAVENGLDANLIVTGEPIKKIKNKRIKYVGIQNYDQIAIWLSKAIASIHLTWIDWCPNSMVEAIVAGCPVIFSDSGGHPEVAKNNGISIKDTQWNFESCDYYHPPMLNMNEIVNAYNSLINKEINVNNYYLNIDNIADQYIKFFKDFL